MDIDLRVDAHVHTAFGKGRDSVGELVVAAEAHGLTEVVFADRVEPDQVQPTAGWLPAYEEAIRRAQRRTEVRLRVAVEVEVVGPEGWLAFPADLRGLDSITVAVSRLPYQDRLLEPDRLRRMIEARAVTPADVTEIAVGATIAAVERSARYVPTRLARPLDVLAKAGVDEAAVPDALLADLATACRAGHVAVEASEAWQRPSLDLAERLVAAGVQLVAASDAYDADHIGRWRYLLRLADRLSPVRQD